MSTANGFDIFLHGFPPGLVGWDLTQSSWVLAKVSSSQSLLAKLCSAVALPGLQFLGFIGTRLQSPTTRAALSSKDSMTQDTGLPPATPLTLFAEL